ncbi:MAG TPA: hypothetical protein VFP71_08290, partial [Candidatus Angelobacter sp.]|nr:hypothetical protein [Candidatus Angelobacter sp.]
TEADWENYKDDLDTKYSHRVFSGRTNEEMQPRFFNNPIQTTDELRWMPRAPFQYYMIGFRDFIQAEVFGPLWAASAASCFLGLVIEKLERHPNHIVPIMPDLLPTIEYVANNQEKFEAEKSIFGDFREKFNRIRELYAAVGGQK